MKKKYSREDVKNIILDIEENYDVCKWKHNGYYLWPVLRIFVYMNLVKNSENVRSDSDPGNISIFSKICSLIRSIKEHIFWKHKKISKLYVSSSDHYVHYDGYKYNKYIDVLMDEDNETPLHLSKSNINSNKIYKPGRHLSYSDFLIGYKVYDKFIKSSTQNSLNINKLCNILSELGVVIKGFENKANRNLKTVDLSVLLAEKLLTKLKPTEIWVICYYSSDIMGIIIAADKLSIPTIDLQHGGQGKNHLAYSSWSNIPTEGYEALPNYFYTWDDDSCQNINGWTKDTAKHKALKFGNPWVEGWKQKEFRKSDYPWPEKLILYTLQPTGEPLDEYVLETIKNTKHRWNWWLRLHPRQMNQKDKISSRLKEFGLYKSVNIEEATKLPLPEILTHTSVHITKFSGCALEAYEFDVPTIIIDKRGVDMYKQYIINNDTMFSLLSKNSVEMQGMIQKFI